MHIEMKMFLFRKQIKRIALLVIIILLFYACFLIFRGEPYELTNQNYKINIIESGINSDENQVECRIPDIPVHSPEMMAFLAHEQPIHCDDLQAWVTCGTNEIKPWLCSISKKIVDRLGHITCDFTEIIRTDNDFDVIRGRSTRSKDDYELIESDFVSVKCWTDNWTDRKFWNGLLTGIRKINVEGEMPKQQKELPFNVIMFGLDSLSRNAFMRKLPKTYEYLTEKLGGVVLKGYNIVGDGTPQALIPILTGYTELELPETRKRITDSKPVDVYPFIFNEYERFGYVTSFNEDLPNVGTFTYRLNGFKNQPTDHYMRPFYLAFEHESNHHKRLCIGDTPRHNVMLQYTSKFMRAYRNTRPQFAFSFHGELSHDSINLVGVADDDIRNWLRDLKTNGLLDRTILIMMSDHGNRFAAVRNTLQGKMEERLPFFSFTFPDAFKQKYPNEFAQFVANVERLTTPFDIHATLLDIIKLQNDGTVNAAKVEAQSKQASRAISLLKPIPKSRSCADAYIEPHWCSCLSLNFINTSSLIIRRAAQGIVDRINAFTEVERNICHSLTVSNITWAGQLLPHRKLLQFKQNRDTDGFLADLTSETKVTAELFQLQIHVLPGNSIFEASLTHDLIKDQFNVNITDISRINMYGSQAHCIMDKNPDLRKYCYCRQPPPN